MSLIQSAVRAFSRKHRVNSDGVTARSHDSLPHQLQEMFEEAEEEVAKQKADGTFGQDAMGKADLARHFNKKLGREEFTT